MLLDDITQAVLARKDVARYLRGGHGQSGAAGARADQRLPRRAPDHAALSDLPRAEAPALSDSAQDRARSTSTSRSPQQATRAGRVIYVSNHKSHLDYLVEPLVLDDNGIRPPVTAAGINLFGGPLGLLHRHVTGAIPIRRNTKDPGVPGHAEGLRRRAAAAHDLLFYIEGGRSYTGELKAPKTGLLHAAMQADVAGIGHRAAGGGLRHRARGSHPAAPGGEAAGAAVRARGGGDGPLRGRLPVARVRHVRQADSARRLRSRIAARRDGRWRHQIRDTIGVLYKVLPTAIVAAAMRPSMTAAGARRARRRASSTSLRQANANLGVQSGREAVEAGAQMLADRNIIHLERGGRFRVRERTVLRYYARTHPTPAGSAPHRPHALMLRPSRRLSFRSSPAARR